MAMSDVLYRLIGRRSPNCPDEATILAYSENRLSQTSYTRFERHFAECEDCREVLAFLGRELDRGDVLPSDTDVSGQTDRVLNYIRNDEINRSTAKRTARGWAGRQISIPRLATVGLVLCAILTGGVFLITRPQPASDAMEAYLSAVKDKRRVEARVSEGRGYAPYQSPTRGEAASSDDVDLHLDRAILKLKSAELESALASDRLLLARAYLARAKRQDTKRALEILEQLAARGVETPEALNDTGVAHYQLGSYDDAIAFFRRALAKSPHFDEALFNRALTEQRAGRNDDAKRDWQQFLDQSKDESWKNDARSHLKTLEGPGGR